MAIIITDMTVCDGGNHVTVFVSEDGGVPRAIAVDFDKLDPGRDFPEIAEHMNEVRLSNEADVEPLYRAVLIIRNANAATFPEMRAAVLAAFGGGQ